jgi:cytochrome P450
MHPDIDLTDLDRFADGFPHELFTTLRREAPVWFQPPTAHTPDGEGFWVLSRHADVAAAALDAATFSSHLGGARDGGGTLIEDLPSGFAAGVLLNMMDDPRHRSFRRLVTPSVSPRARAAMEAELPLQAIARLLGVPQEDRHRLFSWANATLDYDDRQLGQTSAKVQAAQAELFQYGSALLAGKRRCPADDILSAAAHGRIPADAGGDEPLSDLEQQMLFNLLIAAGSETTRNSIALGFAALVEHPDQWCALQADRGLLPRAVEEMLRWASSTPYNRRTATRDVGIRGRTIRAGDKVTLWWASANRDGDVFANPFLFDVRRDPNPHLTFGHGNHFCLGANLARVEMRLVFEGLLDRFDEIALDGPIEWTRSNKHTGVRHIPAAFVRRTERPS